MRQIHWHSNHNYSFSFSVSHTHPWTPSFPQHSHDRVWRKPKFWEKPRVSPVNRCHIHLDSCYVLTIEPSFLLYFYFHVFDARDDLPKLEYLSRVIKEGMRLHCPVPFIQRKLTQPTTVDGVTFPVGTQCTIQILNLHHNPQVWNDPWTFNPDNFTPENLQNKDTYAFVPFSAGPR